MRPLIPIIVCFLLFCLACKKSDHGSGIDYGQGTGNCRISSFTVKHFPATPNEKYTLEYGTDNKLFRLTVYLNDTIAFYRVFQYGGDTIRISVQDALSVEISKISVVLNGLGLIDRILTGSGTQYSYTGNQVTGVTHNYLTPTNSILLTCFWRSGDLDSIRSYNNAGSTSWNTDYSYFNRPAQFADLQFLTCYPNYGAIVVSNTHLTKYASPTAGPWAGYHTYLFDENGKIVNDTIRADEHGAVRLINTFEYECR